MKPTKPVPLKRSQTSYSRLMSVEVEYQEMATALFEIRQLALAHVDGAPVDWKGVVAKIDALRAFQPEKS